MHLMQRRGEGAVTTDQRAIQVFRHRTNRLAAPVVQVVLVGLWIQGDPLALRDRNQPMML